MTPAQLTTARTIANTVARRYALLYRTDPADLAQDGILALHRRADRWSPERGTWSNFARMWITQGIRRAGAYKSRMIRVPECAQSHARQHGLRLADDPVSIDLPLPSGERRDVVADYPDAEQQIIDAQHMAALYAAIDGLPDAHRRAVVEVWLNGAQLRPAGVRLGCSRTMVMNRLNQALPMLRAAMGAA